MKHGEAMRETERHRKIILKFRKEREKEEREKKRGDKKERENEHTNN